MTPCTEDQSRLEPFADGTLAEPSRSEVEAHLSACEACRGEIAAIRSLLTAARSLPREIVPGRELWGGIEAKLSDRPGPGATTLSARRARSLPVGLAVAAALALMLAGGLMATWWQRRTAPAEFARQRARYEEAAAGLASDLARNPATLPEATRLVLDRNLQIIDAAISEAEAALAQEPGNSALAAMLLARHEQRVELLRRARRAGRQES